MRVKDKCIFSDVEIGLRKIRADAYRTNERMRRAIRSFVAN